MSNPFIAHYGKRGMHWGVRNRRKITKLGPSKDAKRTMATVKKAQIHSHQALTNKEIQDFNSRIELERKFKLANPTKIQQGRNAAVAVIAIGATMNKVVKFASSPAGKTLATFLSGKSNSMKEYDVLLRK